MIHIIGINTLQVTVVYSGSVTKAATNGVTEGSFDSRLVTHQEEYQRLADTTGGLFIPSGKFEIDAITPILGDSVKSIDVSQ